MYRYEDALGVKCVSWSPSGQLLSIGSYDEKLRVLNHMTWKTLAEHDHAQTKVDGRSVDVYRAHTFYDGETERTRYAVEDDSVVVPAKCRGQLSQHASVWRQYNQRTHLAPHFGPERCVKPHRFVVKH